MTSLWGSSRRYGAIRASDLRGFPDWHWEMRHIVVDGDYIAVHFTVTGTHRGAFQGIRGDWSSGDCFGVHALSR